MGKNYKVSGTSGEKIALALKKINYPTCYDYSIKHPFDAYNNLQISFEILTNEKLRQSIKTQGVCRWSQDVDKLYPFEIRIKIIKNDKLTIYPSEVIHEIQNTLVHELAHAYDEFFTNGDNDASEQEKRTGNDTRLDYLLYLLQPTEIRSRMNELLRIAKENTRVSHEHKVKRLYKSDTKTLGDEVYLPDYKDYFKSDNKKQRKNYNTSYENLKHLIKKLHNHEISEHVLNFCVDYNIAFVRDSSEIMNNRYYKPLFKSLNKNIPSLKLLNNFLSKIIEVFKMVGQIKSKLSNVDRSSSDYKIMSFSLDSLKINIINSKEAV